ncbi:MAG: GNAT family N-acetyltransferase [Alphaproteobacteria bacterium]|nr:GNAT family N-acetyltransferase [Alphaproteobacteria bacterium]
MNTLLENVSDFSERYLKPDDLPGIVTLQDIVADRLSHAGTPRFIVKRSGEYFAAHLQDPHAMFGVTRPDGELLAQMIFRVSNALPREELGVPELPGLQEGGRFSVAQGMVVHPDWQGNGLMKLLLREWFSWCGRNGIMHLAARTEHSHASSKGGFLKHGFADLGTITDQRDNARVCVLHKILEDGGQ